MREASALCIFTAMVAMDIELSLGEVGMLVSLATYYLRGDADGWWH